MRVCVCVHVPFWVLDSHPQDGSMRRSGFWIVIPRGEVLVCVCVSLWELDCHPH